MATIDKLCVYYHPGEDLAEKLDEMQLTVPEFAQKVCLPANIIQDVIDGKESISADMAIAFEQVTNIPAHMWIDGQRDYDNYILENKRSFSLSRLNFISTGSQGQVPSTHTYYNLR